MKKMIIKYIEERKSIIQAAIMAAENKLRQQNTSIKESNQIYDDLINYNNRIEEINIILNFILTSNRAQK